MQDTTPQSESETVEFDQETSGDAPGATEHRVGDVHVTWPKASVPRPVVVAMALLLLVAIALGTWQVVSLHSQVHNLHQVTQNDGRKLASQGRQLSTLRNSVSAAVGCLESPQAPTGLCVHFLR